MTNYTFKIVTAKQGGYQVSPHFILDLLLAHKTLSECSRAKGAEEHKVISIIIILLIIIKI